MVAVHIASFVLYEVTTPTCTHCTYNTVYMYVYVRWANIHKLLWNIDIFVLYLRAGGKTYLQFLISSGRWEGGKLCVCERHPPLLNCGLNASQHSCHC